MDEEAFKVSIGCLREGGELGWLSSTFTPKGKSHWTYDRFGTLRPDTEIFHSTTRQNKFIKPEFAAMLESQYAGQYALQELGGMFVQMEGAEFPPEYFDYPGFWFDQWPNHLKVKTLALDPSMGGDRRLGDFAAFTRLGVDQEGFLYVEADLRREQPEALTATAIEHVRQFNPDGFAIETNTFQQLFIALFLMAVDVSNPKALAPGLHLPIYEITNMKIDKSVRIRRIGPYLQQKKLRFMANSPGTNLLIQQLRDFRPPRTPGPVTAENPRVTQHVFDDGPDSLEMAIRLAIQLHNQGGVQRIQGYRP
jgi:hypothetical protein